MPSYLVGFEQVPELVKRYKGEHMKEQSTERGVIWFLRPTNNFMLVQKSGNRAKVTFHKDCPCDKI